MKRVRPSRALPCLRCGGPKAQASERGRTSLYCLECAKWCTKCWVEPRLPKRTLCAGCRREKNRVDRAAAVAQAEAQGSERSREQLRRWLSAQVQRTGRIVKEPCAVCGATEVWAFFPENTPAALTWLCPTHHREMVNQTGRYNAYGSGKKRERSA